MMSLSVSEIIGSAAALVAMLAAWLGWYCVLCSTGGA